MTSFKFYQFVLSYIGNFATNIITTKLLIAPTRYYRISATR